MKYFKYIFSVVIVLSCVLLYVFSNRTFTAFESKVKDDILVNIADWKIFVDNQDISKQEKDIKLSNITWESTHTRENKVAPGSKGVVNVLIDPSTTEVAFKYNITLVDHKRDPDVILTVKSITLDGKNLDITGSNTFSGIVTLDDLKKKKTLPLIINVEWVNDETNNEKDSIIGRNEGEANYLKLNFEASQYKGE